MVEWSSDTILRRVLRNTSLLGAGKAVGGLIHLAGLILTARLLGPAGFGALILVRSYAQSAGGLAKFQSWQALIHFGTARADARDGPGFRDLAAFTISADAVTGVGAAIIAAALAPLIAPALGIEAAAVPLAQLYCLAIPLMASATPIGILRIFDRFDHLSWHGVLTPLIRLIGIAVAASIGAPLWAMIAAWLAADAFGELYLWVQGWREMKRQGFVGGAAPSVRRALAENPGLMRFALASNASASLGRPLAPLFTLFTGALLGSAAAGLYRIAQVVLEAVAAPGELAMRSFFPEVTRLRGNDAVRFSAIIRKTLLFSAAVGVVLGIVVALVGPSLLVAAMGASYAEVGMILPVLAVGFAPVLAVLPLEAGLLAMGRAGSVFVARAIAAAVAFAAAALLAGPLGLLGIGLAAVAGFFTTLGAMLFAGRLTRAGSREPS